MTTETELIAKQALRIENLETENEILRGILHSVHMELICVGAPLNDNIHGYTNEQLKIFFKIEDLVKNSYRE